MKKIFFATTNKGKVNTVSKILSDFNIEVIPESLDLPEPRTDDIKQIAKSKVLFAFDKIKKPVIAIDAGFFVHSIGGFPKAFVNFALKTIGVNGILKLVKDLDRSCEFKNCLAFFDASLK